MSDNLPPLPEPQAKVWEYDQLRALQARLGLSQAGLSQYLGVPLPTVRNWLDGLSSPPALLDRLLHQLEVIDRRERGQHRVLAVVETLAPDVHDHLTPGSK